MPQIGILWPQEGDTVSGHVKVQPSAIFGDVWVMKLRVDGVVVDTIDVSAQRGPWLFTWRTNKKDNGSHTLSDELLREDGSIAASSAPISVIVSN